MKREILEFVAATMCSEAVTVINIAAPLNEPIIRLHLYNAAIQKHGVVNFNRRTLDLAAAGDEKAALYAKQRFTEAAQGKHL